MGSKLETKTKYVCLVIRKPSYPNDFVNMLKSYLTANCSRYFFIEHTQDINGYGELEGKHYHIVMVYNNAKRLSTYLNEICEEFWFPNANGLEISKTVSETKSVQYLLHKNNPEKTQHNIDEIVTSVPFGELQVILDSENDDCLTFEKIYKYIEESKGNKLYIIHCLGLVTYKNYRNVILDMIDCYRNKESWLI